MTDTENQEQLLRLMRYNSTKSDAGISLEDYVKSMTEGQKKIYFISAQQKDDVMSNPFMSPFKQSDVPVLIVGNQIDEMVF